MCLGIPGEIVELMEQHEMPYAKVRFAGVARDVCLACVPEARVGDFVLVHVGLAIARIDRDEAARAYRVLEELGQTMALAADAEDEP